MEETKEKKEKALQKSKTMSANMWNAVKGDSIIKLVNEAKQKPTLIRMGELCKSLFKSIDLPVINRAESNALEAFSDIYSILKNLIKGEFNPFEDNPNALRSYIPSKYPEIIKLFTLLKEKISNLHLITDSIIVLGIFGIDYTYTQLIEILCKSITDTKQHESELEQYFSALRIFHDFFFTLVSLGTLILTGEQVGALSETIKVTLRTLQKKLHINLLLENSAKQLHSLARILYYLLQTLVLLSVLSEDKTLEEIKCKTVLDIFKTLFVLMSQYTMFERVFSERLVFEYVWSYTKGKCGVMVGGTKLYSVYLQEGKWKSDEQIEITLRYLVIYYYYHITNLKSFNGYSNQENEFIMYSNMLRKRKSLMDNINVLKESNINIMVYLSENVYILKTLSCCFDEIKRKKFEIVKDIAKDYFFLAIRAGMYYTPNDYIEVEKLSIEKPKDFLGSLFKTLLIYKKVHTVDSKELMNYINMLAVEFASIHIATDSITCLYLYKLYFFQFLSKWDLEYLKEKHTKYSEEMRRYLESYEDNELETPIIRKLKFLILEVALDLYVNFAQLDCSHFIKSAIDLISESYSKEKRLYKSFYIMINLLMKKKIPYEDFESILNESSQHLTLVKESIKESPEVTYFIEYNAIDVLFLIYKTTACSLVQFARQLSECEDQVKKMLSPKSPHTINVKSYIEENHKQILEDIKHVRKILRCIQSFIYALNFSVPIAKHTLSSLKFDKELWLNVVNGKQEQRFMLKLLKKLGDHLVNELKNIELIEKYTLFAMNLLRSINEILIPIEDEKGFVKNFIKVLEELILNNVL